MLKSVMSCSELTPNLIGEICSEYSIVTKKTKRGETKYLNAPMAFDIETSTFKDGDDVRACMYIWQFAIGWFVVYGRTWDEFVAFMSTLRNSVDDSVILPIYVHNLAYEFQFIRGWFDWTDIFAVDSRSVLRATTAEGFEFRCSYLLSGKSLAKVGEGLLKYKVAKMVGDLDYEKTRNSETPLTEAELGYCVNDVMVVTAYIQEEIENNNGKIYNIPMTKTGYVRRYVKGACYSKNNFKTYRKIMNRMTIQSVDEYKQLKRAFQGGFTHANMYNSGKTFEHVKSFDFTSSYPAVIIAEKFPMGNGTLIPSPSSNQFWNCLERYCCIFDIELVNIKPRTNIDHPLSYSKCWDVKDAQLDNGRIIKAGELKTTITEIDFKYLREFYYWERISVANLRYYPKQYLPTPFVKSVIEFYRDKTTLKDVEGKEVEYLLKKEMLNSCYGMMVTDPCRPIIDTDTWEKTLLTGQELEDALNKYNNSPNRFSFYAWGVYVTAYARRNLFSGILSVGEDYIYSDTDSIKFLNYEEHLDYIEAYNKHITMKLEAACRYHHIDPAEVSPKTVQGKIKPLGVWDDDGLYNRFKTLGAKRYMVETDNGIKITVAGLAKKKAAEYIAQQPDPFEFFGDGMEIPEDYSGRTIHGYIDEPTRGICVDYNGNAVEYFERSSITIEKSSYHMTLGEDYEKLIDILSYTSYYGMKEMML